MSLAEVNEWLIANRYYSVNAESFILELLQATLYNKVLSDVVLIDSHDGLRMRDDGGFEFAEEWKWVYVWGRIYFRYESDALMFKIRHM